MQNGYGNVLKYQFKEEEALKGEAKDEPAAPVPLGPQGPSGAVMSDNQKLQGSRHRDLVGVLPQGKGARGGPAEKVKSAKVGNLQRRTLPDHRRESRQLSLLNIICDYIGRVIPHLEEARAQRV